MRRAVEGPGRGRVHRREHPRGVRRWRRGADRAGAGLRGDRRGGHAATAPGGLRRDLGRGAHRVRYRGAARDLAARPGQRHLEGGVRDHRTGRRLQHPSPVHDGQAGRRGLGAERHQVLHLRGRRGRGAPGGRAGPARTRCRCSSSRPTPRAWTSTCCRSTCCCRSGSSPCTSTASGSARARWSARRARGSGRCSTG